MPNAETVDKHTIKAHTKAITRDMVETNVTMVLCDVTSGDDDPLEMDTTKDTAHFLLRAGRLLTRRLDQKGVLFLRDLVAPFLCLLVGGVGVTVHLFIMTNYLRDSTWPNVADVVVCFSPSLKSLSSSFL